jgi:hypothetical protein
MSKRKRKDLYFNKPPKKRNTLSYKIKNELTQIIHEETIVILLYQISNIEFGFKCTEFFKTHQKDSYNLLFNNNNLKYKMKSQTYQFFLKECLNNRKNKFNDLKKIVNKYFITEFENARIPKLKRDIINWLISKICDIEYNQSKRNTELSNINEISINFKFFNIIIPVEIMSIIFEFVKKTFDSFKSIGLVNTSWYILFLKKWKYININYDNLRAIPILVLTSVKRAKLNYSISVTDIVYLFKKIGFKNLNTLVLSKVKKRFFDTLLKRKIVLQINKLVIEDINPCKKKININPYTFPKLKSLTLPTFCEQKFDCVKIFKKINILKIIKQKYCNEVRLTNTKIPTILNKLVNIHTIDLDNLYISKSDWINIFGKIKKLRTLKTHITTFFDCINYFFSNDLFVDIETIVLRIFLNISKYYIRYLKNLSNIKNLTNIKLVILLNEYHILYDNGYNISLDIKNIFQILNKKFKKIFIKLTYNNISRDNYNVVKRRETLIKDDIKKYKQLYFSNMTNLCISFKYLIK